MGSFISAHSMFTGKNERNEENKHRICYSCSKKIDDKTFIICVRCKITLHKDCEETYGNKYYTVTYKASFTTSPTTFDKS